MKNQTRAFLALLLLTSALFIWACRVTPTHNETEPLKPGDWTHRFDIDAMDDTALINHSRIPDTAGEKWYKYEPKYLNGD